MCDFLTIPPSINSTCIDFGGDSEDARTSARGNYTPLMKSGYVELKTAIPDSVPVEYKVPIAVTSWLVGIVGFSIKEALGGQAPKA